MTLAITMTTTLTMMGIAMLMTLMMLMMTISVNAALVSMSTRLRLKMLALVVMTKNVLKSSQCVAFHLLTALAIITLVERKEFGAKACGYLLRVVEGIQFCKREIFCVVCFDTVFNTPTFARVCEHVSVCCMDGCGRLSVPLSACPSLFVYFVFVLEQFNRFP